MVSQWQLSQSQKRENGMELSEGDPGEVNGKFSVERCREDGRGSFVLNMPDGANVVVDRWWEE